MSKKQEWAIITLRVRQHKKLIYIKRKTKNDSHDELIDAINEYLAVKRQPIKISIKNILFMAFTVHPCLYY